jgi:hypothetical protein
MAVCGVRANVTAVLPPGGIQSQPLLAALESEMSCRVL